VFGQCLRCRAGGRSGAADPAEAGDVEIVAERRGGEQFDGYSIAREVFDCDRAPGAVADRHREYAVGESAIAGFRVHVLRADGDDPAAGRARRGW